MQTMLRKFVSGRRAAVDAFVFTVGTLLLGMLIYNAARELDYKRKCTIVKQNLHAIQLAAERYSVDSPESSYPRNMKELIKGGYLEQFPTNPFSGLPMRCVAEQTDAVKFSAEDVPPEAEPGDFMYYKRYGRDGQKTPNEAPQGYSLAAYM